MARRLIKIAVCAVVPIFMLFSLSAHAADSSTLETERQNLSAARSAYISALEEYQALLDQGALDQTGSEDYAEYLGRLKMSVANSCDRISVLKNARDDPSPEAGCEFSASTLTGPVSFPEESTEAERVVRLEQRLGSSMSAFDEELLREMEKLEKQRSGSPDGSSGAGSAQGEGGESGSGMQADGSGEEGSEGNGEVETGEPGSGTNQVEQDDEQVAARQQGSGEQQQGSTGNSKDSAGGTSVKVDEPPAAADDDIVARQLREAAENETDPVLREKLWDEYRRYKADTAVKSSKNNN